MLIEYQGQRPHLDADDIKDKEFTATEHFGMEKPHLPFEDLCRAVIEKGKKDDLQNADITTDTQTLWAIFQSIYEKSQKTKVKKHDKGICLAVHIEHATTYIKVVNSYEIDGEALTAATSKLKEARQGYLSVKVGPSKTRESLNAFKRVLSYGWGGMELIVQDDNQITVTTPGKQDILQDSLGTKDGSV